jgi:hypothetical protein
MEDLRTCVSCSNKNSIIRKLRKRNKVMLKALDEISKGRCNECCGNVAGAAIINMERIVE